MSGGRPSRGARVVYREVNSDDSDYEYDDFTKVVTIEPINDDSNDADYAPRDNSIVDVPPPKVVYPPLSPIQQQLRKVCRLGDKELLRTFLTDNPGIELDVKDPDGGTLLTEAATKTAQFCDIAEVLIVQGAGLEVTDSLGNTPLHNAVLYYPSTQKTVDFLLKRGADITAKNNDGMMPEGLAEDKDLKMVLKELRKAAGRKKCLSSAVSLYESSPDMRKKVFDQVLMEERFKQIITVKYNNPVIVNSPGLLKRKRKFECLDDSFEGGGQRTKRIRWNELDSTGAEIDPQFSSEEDECVTSQDEDDHDTSDTRADSEEDVVIVHNDVKKSQILQSDTELCLVKHSNSGNSDDIETYFYEDHETADKKVEVSETDKKVEDSEVDKKVEDRETDKEENKGITEAANPGDKIQYKFEITEIFDEGVDTEANDTKKAVTDSVHSSQFPNLIPSKDSSDSNNPTNINLIEQIVIEEPKISEEPLVQKQFETSENKIESVETPTKENELKLKSSTDSTIISTEASMDDDPISAKIIITSETKTEDAKVDLIVQSEANDNKMLSTDQQEIVSDKSSIQVNTAESSIQVNSKDSQPDSDQTSVVLKCSQGFGFFVS